MIAPGVYNLGDFTVTAAGTVVGDAITGLDGMLACALQARLAYGSGGATIKVYVQTSFDQGATWTDIACFAFAQTSAVEAANLSALTPVTTLYALTDGSLTDDTVKDGMLGDRLRVKIVSVGTYAGSTLLSVRALVR